MKGGNRLSKGCDSNKIHEYIFRRKRHIYGFSINTSPVQESSKQGLSLNIILFITIRSNSQFSSINLLKVYYSPFENRHMKYSIAFSLLHINISWLNTEHYTSSSYKKLFRVCNTQNLVKTLSESTSKSK